MKPTQEQLNDPKWWTNVPDGNDYCYYDHSQSDYFFEEMAFDSDDLELLAKRPTKPAFVPEVGVECEYSLNRDPDRLFKCKPRYVSANFVVADCFINEEVIEQAFYKDDVEFRPIKSERELFVEQLANLGKGYGSLYSEEFAGEVYDSGLFCLKEADK